MSEFDDDLDKYPDAYEVFIVFGIANLSVLSDWKSIEPLPKTRVGKVSVAAGREWLVDSNAIPNGLIDQTSVRIREIPQP